MINPDVEIAAQRGNVEFIVDWFGKQGHDVRGKRGYDAMRYAAYSGRIEVVRALLTLGADVEARWRLMSSPLSAAALGGRIEIMQLLLENEADVNGYDGLGQTPLLCAAQQGHYEAMMLLLEHGANL